ncbi:hypothetical protein [Bradyrhizobium sp. F1.4.3]|uniref:hypothetical protein n=1 Tax=Bradyrhizobium sp. F1.4.3 TaxID=3156356 RepID=UPI003399A33A
MMNVKAAKEALQALWSRLQVLAIESVRDEADFVERRAFQDTAFLAQSAVRGLSLGTGRDDLRGRGRMRGSGCKGSGPSRQRA